MHITELQFSHFRGFGKATLPLGDRRLLVLADLRRTPDITWEGVHGDQKQAMRAAALAEQRGLCAYCNSRIRSDSSTLEHWLPRSRRDSDPFAWEHLLAVCEGGQGGPELHCDKRRGDSALTLHPARRAPDTEAVVTYLADGRARGATTDQHREIDDVLGLNAAILRRARKQVVQGVLQQVTQARRLQAQAGRLAALERLRAPYVAQAGDLPPFPIAVLPLLERALTHMKHRFRKLPSTRPPSAAHPWRCGAPG